MEVIYTLEDCIKKVQGRPEGYYKRWPGTWLHNKNALSAATEAGLRKIIS